MSEPAGSATLPAVTAVEPPTYSKDYWDNVFEQIARRPLVKAALAVLAVIYASAIYAPWIANDRPYVLEAIDERAYNDARRGLVGVAGSLRDLVAEGRAAYTQRLASNADAPDYAGAVRAEGKAMALRLADMRTYLPSDARPPLEEFGASVRALVEAAVADPPSARAADAEPLVERARALRDGYEPAKEAGASGIALVGSVSRPLAASISGVEAFFMMLWLFVLAWPAWNRALNRWLLGGDRARIRGARRWKLSTALGVSAVFALGWQLFVGGQTSFDLSPYKERLTKGEIRATRVLFPPLCMGFSETHMAESFRPPTWIAASELDEHGAYVRGARVPEPDAITGAVPATEPVDVRYGEPPRNSPWRHALGTDILGRDLAVRILYGGRISLAVGFVSTLVLVLIGVLVGAVAGYFGGWTDTACSRLIEVVQSIPAFFLILTAVALIPERSLNPIFTIVLLIGIVRWTGVARLVRGEFLKLKEQEFVVAARALGLRPSRVIFRHVLPNALGPVLVAAAFSVASGILTESAISFLGFGVKHPIPSWGSLLNESRAAEQWWLQVFPGLLIFLTVFCYNLVGEGIRDALDPRMKV